MLYTVTETKVVTDEDVEIEYDTDTAQLTLYTCNTLYEKNSKDRFVVIAVPVFK